MDGALKSDISEKFQQVLRTHLQFVNNTGPFPVDENLNQLGLDSMSAVDLLLDLEESFGILFPDDLLTAETFQTASTLQKAVQSLMYG